METKEEEKEMTKEELLKMTPEELREYAKKQQGRRIPMTMRNAKD